MKMHFLSVVGFIVLVLSSSVGASDKRKQSVYFPAEMLKQMQYEAARQDRSMSWIAARAWTAGRDTLKKFPSVNEIYDKGDANLPPKIVSSGEKRKQSLYFTPAMLKEMQHEAARQDRSLSWVVQQAWLAGRDEVRKLPGVNEVY